MHHGYNKQGEIAEIAESFLKEFRAGMAFREQPGIRIGRRMTRIVRTGITANMQLLNNQFTDMNRIVSNMATNTSQIPKHMKMFPF